MKMEEILCEICGSPKKTREHAIDHCHVTGQVRGRLCVNCNIGLGHFQDDPRLLGAAILYLAKYEYTNEGE